MTENTTASGAADDSLLICASDLQHSAIYDNPHEMVDCVRAVADRITALAASAPVAPLQPGEYLPLPVPSGRIEYPAQRYEDAWVSTQDAYSEEQMHAYVDADRAARGAAQAAPAEDDKWRSLALQFDSHRMQALSHLKLLLECGEDHADAVRTFLAGPPLDGESVLAQRIAAYAQPAPVAEDAEIRKALDDAATSLETISRIAGRDKDMLGMMDVRLYAAARAKAAREAQAAQPEGGNHG